MQATASLFTWMWVTIKRERHLWPVRAVMHSRSLLGCLLDLKFDGPNLTTCVEYQNMHAWVLQETRFNYSLWKMGSRFWAPKRRDKILALQFHATACCYSIPVSVYIQKRYLKLSHTFLAALTEPIWFGFNWRMNLMNFKTR